MPAQEVVALLLAAKNGDLQTLNSVSDKVTEDVKDDHGATCLHYAARGGNLSVVQYLVTERGFNPTTRSSFGATALHDVAATGQLTVLRWLLGHGDSRVDDQDGTGATVVHLSARYGHTQMLEWLLDETNCDVLKKSASGALPLHFAAEGGHLECVKLLMAEAPRSVNMQMNSGATPVYMSCQQGHLEVAEYLAANNGTPKIYSYDGMSTLHGAAQTGQLHIVKWLIRDQLLNPNDRDFDGATPLHYAASHGRVKVIEWLLREGGAKIILDNVGGSPLHTAAEFGNSKIVRTLLKNGCDRHITDNEGLTAEELADKCGHKKTAAILRGEPVSEDEDNGAPSAPPPVTAHSAGTSSSSPKRSTSSSAPRPSSPVLRTGSGQSGLGRAHDSPENLHIGRFTAGGWQRPTSLESVASSESSFGYFPGGGGRTEVVRVDVHETPNIFNSHETGSRESDRFPLNTVNKTCINGTNHDRHSTVTSATGGVSASSASSSSFLPKQHSSSSSGITTVTVSNKNHQDRAGIRESLPERREEPLYSSHRPSAGDNLGNMEDGVNGNEGVKKSSSLASNGSEGSAKSVININSKNVTIISTGKSGSSQSKVTTTPLRSGNDDRHLLSSSSHVSTRKKDAEFINSLSQKFQNGGSAVTHLATASSFRGTGNRVSSLTEDQRKQISSSIGSVGQRKQNSESVAAPSVAMNGYANGDSTNGENGDANGVSGDSSPRDYPASPVPPLPPVGDKPQVRKADASYTPRPKSHTASANGLGTPPHTAGSAVVQQKNDLMAALTAVVTSGSPSSVLRKTRGPGKGALSEVHSSKKTDTTTAPTTSESQTSSLPPTDEFDPKKFLDQVPETDSAGNKIPDWRRQMTAKKLAQTAQEEYMEQKKVNEYEAKFKGMPNWKRALLEKKDGNPAAK